MVDINLLVGVAYGVVLPNTPVDTLNLYNSITTEARGGNSIVTTLNATTAIYGIFLDDGVDPFTIEVKNAKVLSNGINFFGRKVNHPGIQQHVGFFSTKIYLAQVDAIRNALTGQTSPIGQNLQNGAIPISSPAMENAYTKSLGAYKDKL